MKISVVTPTHDPKFLDECLRSLQTQENAPDWEWVLLPSSSAAFGHVTKLAKDHPRIVVAPNFATSDSVGTLKRNAMSFATGDVLLELDHDDLLAPQALTETALAFEDRTIDFVYSDTIDFPGKCTYHDPERRLAWEGDGWKFGTLITTEGATDYPLSWEPSALALSTIHYAPNHLRAWRRDFYQKIGGHSDLPVCDDLELLQRTYINGRMKRIPRPLYFYRVHGGNTWLAKNQLIQEKSAELRANNLQDLCLRECELRGLPCYDLCGGIDSPGMPWISVDKKGAEVGADLRVRWPFPDSSVGAFRAFDAIEHLPDKIHTMSEIYRCLAPGGFLFSRTPSATGPGAFQDPTHVSYWVENSFRYYTEERLARYIENTTERFMEMRVFTTDESIPYVIADLVSLKDDDGRIPGKRRI